MDCSSNDLTLTPEGRSSAASAKPFIVEKEEPNGATLEIEAKAMLDEFR